VPGIGLGPEAWQPTLRHVGDRVAGQVVTLPGYGVPARTSDDLRPPALAERVAAALSGAREPAVLVGHSASCQVVVHVARMRGDRVCGLVLIGPTTDPRAATWPRLARRWLATARHEDPRQVPALVRQYHRTGPGSMRRAMDAARRDPIAVALRGTGCPLLVLRGHHDRICPAPWAEDLARTRSRDTASAAVTLSTGGHMVPLTRGRQVADELLGFLSLAVGRCGVRG
jgi:pimeloyl-ACP methyl ester carboxylesterase